MGRRRPAETTRPAWAAHQRRLGGRHHIGCLVRLSESLRMRADRGEHPTVLGRADMEAFLHRLAYLESVGQISGDARIRARRTCRRKSCGSCARTWMN